MVWQSRAAAAAMLVWMASMVHPMVDAWTMNHVPGGGRRRQGPYSEDGSRLAAAASLAMDSPTMVPPSSIRSTTANRSTHKERVPATTKSSSTMNVLPLEPSQQASLPESSSSRRSLSTPIHTFETMPEMLTFLQDLPTLQQDDDQEQWYVVKYFVSYCKVCQRSALNYKKIALEYAAANDDNDKDKEPSTVVGHRNRVHFVRADATSWTGVSSSSESSSSSQQQQKWLKQLGITKFPFVQVYRGRTGACVASFSTGGTSYMFARRVRETLQAIVTRSPQEWKDFEQNCQSAMDENAQVRRQVLQDYYSVQQHSPETDEEQEVMP